MVNAVVSPLFPAVLLLAIGLIDLVLNTWVFGVLAFGLLDWIGHLSTAGILLLAVAGSDYLGRHHRFTTGAILGSVLIDVDHILLYTHVPHIAVTGGRPFTHTLGTVAVLAAVWMVSGRRWSLLGGLTVGVLLHFVRDVATGSGLALWWPFSDAGVEVGYPVYVVIMVIMAAVATVRALRRHRN